MNFNTHNVSKDSFINTADLNYGPQSTMKDIQGKQITHSQTYRRKIYTTIQDKSILWRKAFWMVVSALCLLIIKENVQGVQLLFSCRHCSRDISGTLFPSTTSDWGCLLWVPTKHSLFQSCCKMWICSVGFVHGSCTVLLHHIFFLQFRRPAKHIFFSCCGADSPPLRSAVHFSLTLNKLGSGNTHFESPKSALIVQNSPNVYKIRSHLPFISSSFVRVRSVGCCDCSCWGVGEAWGVGGCGVAGDKTDTPVLELELGAATVTAGAALVAVLGTACVWAAGDDATAIRPDRDVADVALPVPTESGLTDSGFCAAGRIICGYCGKESNVLACILIWYFSLSVSIYGLTITRLLTYNNEGSMFLWNVENHKPKDTVIPEYLNPQTQHCENPISCKILAI